MSKEIKICGTTSTLDLDVAVKAGADAIGIISDYYSRGNIVNRHRTSWFIRSAPPDITSVLVSCFKDAETNIDLIKRTRPDRVQLGEVEDPRLAEAIFNMEERPQIAQVFHVKDDTTPDVLDDFLDFIDYAHFDTYDPARPGGTGRTHDWQRSRELVEAAHEAGKLTILAGGLTFENVGEAIRVTEPDGVDVESGIKDICGAHDARLTNMFVQAARAAFSETAEIAA